MRPKTFDPISPDFIKNIKTFNVETANKYIFVFRGLIPSKKNSRAPGKHINYAYKKWENSQAWNLPKFNQPIEKCHIKWQWYKLKEQKAPFDCSNKQQSIEDCLQRYNILKNDNYKVIISEERPPVILESPENIQAVVEITRL